MLAERGRSRRSFLAALAFLSLFITIALAIPYLLASKLSTREIPITLRVRLEGFPQRLPVRVNVYELTEKGARRVARTLLRGPPSREGLTFDLTARGALNVFAYAYDQDEGALYAASAYVAVCPELREYVVDLAARRARQSWVSGEEVPAPDKYSQVLDRQVDNVTLAACSAPAGASCYVKLRGVELLVQAHEKMYWTLDPTLRAWNEEGWASTGYVYYKLDFDASYLWSNGSLYFFPTKVDYVVATVSESKLPPLERDRPLHHPGPDLRHERQRQLRHRPQQLDPLRRGRVLPRVCAPRPRRVRPRLDPRFRNHKGGEVDARPPCEPDQLLPRRLRLRARSPTGKLQRELPGGGRQRHSEGGSAARRILRSRLRVPAHRGKDRLGWLE